jgi:hypothetical protein
MCAKEGNGVNRTCSAGDYDIIVVVERRCHPIHEQHFVQLLDFGFASEVYQSECLEKIHDAPSPRVYLQTKPRLVNGRQANKRRGSVQ